ncbi:MAG: tetratricopeptide repeat protein [Pseudomonadales bacterium]|nr:tetratricopeptide repeat protein [Pseudomonadales bacterium]
MNTLLPYRASQVLDGLLTDDVELDKNHDLVKAALLFSLENEQDFILDEQLALLTQLSKEASLYVDLSAGTKEIAKNFCYFFKEIKGFQCNVEDYYDPENSFLNKVMENRQGIPISMAVLYIGVASQLGFNDISGVAFPGHFLLKLGEGSGEAVYVDPFYHKLINDSECVERLQSLFGKHARMHRSYLQTVTNRELIARMARNLVEIYQEKHLYELALICCARAMKMEPSLAEDHYVRAKLYEKLDCYLAAVQEYSRFIYLSPKDERIGDIKVQIRRLREAFEKPKYIH